MRANITILTLCFSLLLAGCQENDFGSNLPEGEVTGYKPIYYDVLSSSDITTEGVQPMRNVGKIILVGTTLLVNERFRGIHIIDNSDPSQPKQTGFINIPGNLELSKKGDYIYANNLEDLVTIKVEANGSIQVTDRKVGVFPNATNDDDLTSTIPYSSYMECIDESKGRVIGWERTTIVNPQCYK